MGKMSQNLKFVTKRGENGQKNDQNGLILVGTKQNEFNGWKLNVMQY